MLQKQNEQLFNRYRQSSVRRIHKTKTSWASKKTLLEYQPNSMIKTSSGVDTQQTATAMYAGELPATQFFFLKTFTRTNFKTGFVVMHALNFSAVITKKSLQSAYASVSVSVCTRRSGVFSRLPTIDELQSKPRHCRLSPLIGLFA